MNIAVSVVMPVYNSEKYLAETIESILDQTLRNFEFIIVDDYSTDSSWDIVQEYAKKDQRIIAVKNTSQKGCYSARNYGLDLIKGKYYAVMDSDDIAKPDRFQKQFDFMEQNTDIDVCGTWYELFGERKGLVKAFSDNDEIKSALFFYDCIAHPTVIIRKETLDKYNIKYNDNFPYAQDYELWCRESAKLNFANIPKVLLKYRVHQEQIGSSKISEQNDIKKQILDLNMERTGESFTSKEKGLFFKYIARDKKISDAELIIEVSSLVLKLKSMGGKPSKSFNKILSNFWWRTLMNNTHLGFQTIKIFLKNRPDCYSKRYFLKVAKLFCFSFFYGLKRENK